MKKTTMFVALFLLLLMAVGIHFATYKKDKVVTEYSEVLVECKVVERSYTAKHLMSNEKYITIVDYNGFICTIDDKTTYEISEYSNKIDLKLVTIEYEDSTIITSIVPLSQEVII